MKEISLFRINHRGGGVNAQQKAFNNPAGRKISWKNEQVSSGILLPVGPHCAALAHATRPIYAYRNSRVSIIFPSFFLSGQIFKKGSFQRTIRTRIGGERDPSISQERWITRRFELSSSTLRSYTQFVKTRKTSKKDSWL